MSSFDSGCEHKAGGLNNASTAAWRLLGEFIKSRLEKLGLLKVGDPITQNILLSYGAECIEIERFTDINKPIKDDLSNKVYLITF